jgi:glyoxylase-like metal-dependent hydrolase (beta-lactamase superfamily II)
MLVKRLLASAVVVAVLRIASFARAPATQIDGKRVFKNDDVVFHRIDEHTRVGSGHIMASESLYLVEGNDKAVLIDAGTRITDLDTIVASLTKKRVMRVVTHAHPDHTGSAINDSPGLYIGAGDAASPLLSTCRGKIRELKDADVIDLGGRTLNVVATPGHTPGSTTFIDKTAGYGFSGDSFGSGNLLLGGTFSTLLATCRKTSALMEEHGIKHLYPGHFFGKNAETKQRLDDMATISKDVLVGKVKGEPNPRGMMGLDLIITAYGVRINYSENSVK